MRNSPTTNPTTSQETVFTFEERAWFEHRVQSTLLQKLFERGQLEGQGRLEVWRKCAEDYSMPSEGFGYSYLWKLWNMVAQFVESKEI